MDQRINIPCLEQFEANHFGGIRKFYARMVIQNKGFRLIIQDAVDLPNLNFGQV